MKQTSTVQWIEPPKASRWASLTKNLAVSAALLVSLVALRSGAIPSAVSLTGAVMTAATNDTLLDDQLGKLTFVSSLFPEATLVFGETNGEGVLACPVSGGEVVQTWSEETPYVMLSSDGKSVCSAIDGEVMGVYHGDGEELLVHVQRSDGLSVICGNLASVQVQTGDAVCTGMLLGYLPDGAACALEVRQDGWSIDPTSLLLP
ncbi:MAG: hypothetical protein IKK21_06035 [Clostridia bacterium]|nr:hypothetical protein [Clostridia bacterium]